jgi:carbonic anhydrase/acetyltransferase-like protein (isoleucine patch superfamily)
VTLVLPYRNKLPRVAEKAWVADNATLIGDIEIEDQANIWFGCILRGDVADIFVGAGTNIQDGTIVHGARGLPGTHIGRGVTIGHMALIHACRLEDKCFIGMKACVLDGAVVESGAMVAAGAVVPPGKRVLAGQLWGGTPARPMRDLTEKEKRNIEELPLRYSALAEEYRRPA